MSKGSDDALDDLCKVTPKLVDEATELVATLELVTETKRALCNLLVQVFEFVVISENLEYRAVSVQQRQKSHRLSTQSRGTSNHSVDVRQKWNKESTTTMNTPFPEIFDPRHQERLVCSALVVVVTHRCKKHPESRKNRRM